MAVRYLPFSELDELIRSGWGDTPRHIIDLIRQRHNGELPTYHWLHVQRVKHEITAKKHKEKPRDAVADQFPPGRRYMP